MITRKIVLKFINNDQRRQNMEPRNISKQEAMEVLEGFVNEGLILLEPEMVPGKVNLDGCNPYA
jgi:hypothetical protein